MKYFVTVDGTTREVEVADGRIRLDGKEIAAHLASLPGSDRRHLRVDGGSVGLFARRDRDGESWVLELEGRTFRAIVEDERRRRVRELASAGRPAALQVEVRAPMPGLVVRIEIGTGDRVEEGDPLVVVEAMKMENELRAPAAGRVAEVRVEPGRTVERDEILVVLLPGDGPEEE
ncbi:MAG: biotin/lipoyl-containing protein [Gemmatimonadota bacterium]|nr:biotin/lipoyl-containing protein [Gemmatimonadota bacterium]